MDYPNSSISNRARRSAVHHVLFIIGALLLAPSAVAQSSGGDFEISSHTVDNGGGTSSGGDFVLTGTIGQPDASLQTASGGDFQLTGGFWASGAVTPPGELLFSDGFESLP